MELGKCTVSCTALENVLYEIENSDKLSKIKKSDKLFNIKSTSPSTGNAPKSIVTSHCYMAEEVHVKATKIPQSRNLTPVTIMVADTIGTVKSRRLLKVLLDSGSTTTLINKRCLPRKCQPCKTSQSRMVNTLAGNYQSSAMVVMRNLRLPELDKNRNIEQHKALIFESENCKYDVILGADFLTKTGIDVKYSTNTIEWFENELPLRDPHLLKDEDFASMATIIEIQQEVEFFGMDWYDPDCYAIEILDAKYEKVQIDEVVKQLEHLNIQQKADIKQVLSEFTKIFDGTLGVYPHRKFHIDLEPNAKPKHARPYPVSVIHLEAFIKELAHLCKIGVLATHGASEWASPTFITPKKDGRVRWVSDLRELNKVVIRRQYPLPIIQDILRRRPGYQYFTKMDISMQYYTFELDDESKDLCTIATPFGKFKYNRLPMGLKCSPDFSQEVMENIFRDISETEVYIDDIGVFTNSWEEHMKVLCIVLQKLQENGFTINPLKCEWAVKETDWLGYWLTPNGVKPWRKKIDAILRMQPPTTLKLLRGFIGMVNYYRDMWPHRSDILAPLTSKTGTPKKGEKTSPFNWTPEMQRAFDEMKALMTADVLCAYPNHNKPFHIYTDASNYQLGACIMQDSFPVAYYSRKLNSAQMNYATIDKELLCIIATIREFRSMLLGAELHIHTDHKNILHVGDSSERRLRWISYVDEYSPTLHYVVGPLNVIADTFSRLSRLDDTSALVGKKTITEDSNSVSYSIYDDIGTFKCLIHLPCLTNLKTRKSKLNKRKRHDQCYLNLPEDILEDNPLDIENIKERQLEDNELQQSVIRHPEWFNHKTFNEVTDVLCYTKPGDNPANWKIALPSELINPTVRC